jgi:hypothetical protein
MITSNNERLDKIINPLIADLRKICHAEKGICRLRVSLLTKRSVYALFYRADARHEISWRSQLMNDMVDFTQKLM